MEINESVPNDEGKDAKPFPWQVLLNFLFMISLLLTASSMRIIAKSMKLRNETESRTARELGSLSTSVELLKLREQRIDREIDHLRMAMINQHPENCQSCLGTGFLMWNTHIRQRKLECPVCNGTGKDQEVRHPPVVVGPASN